MTLIRNVKGHYSDDRHNLLKSKVVVRFTSDNAGETLSLECRGKQILVNYRDIERIVQKERSYGYKNGHDIIDEGWGES